MTQGCLYGAEKFLGSGAIACTRNSVLEVGAAQMFGATAGEIISPMNAVVITLMVSLDSLQRSVAPATASATTTFQNSVVMMGQRVSQHATHWRICIPTSSISALGMQIHIPTSWVPIRTESARLKGQL